VKFRGILLTAAVLTGPLAAAGPRMTEVITPDCRLISVLKLDEAQEYIEKIRRFRQLINKITARAADPAATPVSLYVIPEKVWRELGHGASDGFMNLTPAGARIIIKDQLYEKELDIAFYLLASYLLRQGGSAHSEPWYAHGLGAVLRGTEFKGNEATLRVPGYTVLYLRSGNWIPMGEMLEKNWQTLKEATPMTFNASAWALMHYGMIHNHEFGKKIPDYVKARQGQRPVEQAVREIFCMSLAELDTTIHNYAIGSELMDATLDLPPLPPPQILTARKLDETAGTLELVDILIYKDRANKRARSMLDSVLRKEPGNTRALALHGLTTEAEALKAPGR
jgi:hypothetical protein